MVCQSIFNTEVVLLILQVVMPRRRPPAPVNQPAAVSAPNPSESSLTPCELQSLMASSQAGIEMANKFASSSKAQDQFTKRDIEFANPGIEIQFRIAEETLFYLNKEGEK